MASDSDIANMALSHLGNGTEISDLDTELSKEAKACRVFFDLARESVLRDFAWPFATKIVALALLEEDPNDEWLYSYTYPADCLMFRKIQSGLRTDTRSSRVPYRIAQGSGGRVIFTDTEDAVAEYTVLEDTADRYFADFQLALSYRLAALIAPRVTGGDQFKLGDKAMRNYEIEISKAKAAAANEEQPDQEPDSELISVRNS